MTLAADKGLNSTSQSKHNRVYFIELQNGFTLEICIPKPPLYSQASGYDRPIEGVILYNRNN